MVLDNAVAKYKNGNKKVFDYIYNETMPLVRFAVYSVIPNKSVIEDLIQDVYMKVDKLIATYQENNFRAWIYQVAKNTALDYVKHKKEFLANSYDYLADVRSNHPYLYYAIRHLEEDEREVFLMKVLCGHTTKRIAQILCLTPNVVNNIYYETKEKLKRCLEVFENEDK